MEKLQECSRHPESKLKEIVDPMKSELEKYSDILSHESHVYAKNLNDTYNNYKRDSTAFKSKPWLEGETDFSTTLREGTLVYACFFYPCHKSNTCSNFVMLLSDMDKKEINQSAFKEVIESLEMHDVPTD